MLEGMASMLRPKGWLGLGWAVRNSGDRILGKGGKNKQPKECVWLEPEREPHRCGSCRAFWILLFVLSPRQSY